ncbi:hypothetical protein [Streptomyces sp. CB01881]|uniref:hypothetical protein n=1 Tax=Streptomyces sp. CB01881 TaxID=2078691 RepID=UPI0011DF5E9B|nr:hypothetical protein [Streptomyces sp. CB01881]TYC68671.1 hypothetical protein EH183_37975 [Streptomyces sp. CB01881]
MPELPSSYAEVRRRHERRHQEPDRFSSATRAPAADPLALRLLQRLLVGNEQTTAQLAVCARVWEQAGEDGAG